MAVAMHAQAQKKVQGVSKIIERQLDYHAGGQINIKAEKAKISLKGWSKNQISLTLKLISKHPKKEVALKELVYSHYDISHQGRDQFITNYFHSNENYSRVKSNLLVEYTLYVPRKCRVSIDNRYGTVNIEGVDAEISLSGKFCDIKLMDVKGILDLQSDLGDVYALNLNVVGNLTLHNANLDLKNAAGSYLVKSHYGQIDIAPGFPLRKLAIDSKKSKVRLHVDQLETYNYDLATTFAPIETPGLVEVVPDQNITGRKMVSLHHGNKPKITVNTTLSLVQVNLLYDASRRKK